MKKSELKMLIKLYKKYQHDQGWKIMRIKMAQSETKKHNGRPRKSKWTDDQMKQAVLKYIRSRYSIRDTAKHYGVPAGSLYYHVKKYRVNHDPRSAIVW